MADRRAPQASSSGIHVWVSDLCENRVLSPVSGAYLESQLIKAEARRWVGAE
jgi:hypothetical protein